MMLQGMRIDERKAGFTATRQFRVLVMGLALAVSVLVVWIFEIGPMLSGRSVPRAAARPIESPQHSPEDGGRAVIPFHGVLNSVEDGTPPDEGDGTYLHLLGCLERAG